MTYHIPKCVRILEALMRGHYVKIGSFEYYLDGGHEIRATRMEGELRVLLSPGSMRLSSFIDMCETVNKDEYEVILKDLAFDPVKGDES